MSISIRFGPDIAETPEASEYTSIRERLRAEFDLQASAIEDQTACGDMLDFRSPLKPLLHFENRQLGQTCRAGIPFDFKDYLEPDRLDRPHHSRDKRGHIEEHLPSHSRPARDLGRSMAHEYYAVRGHSSAAIQSTNCAA